MTLLHTNRFVCSTVSIAIRTKRFKLHHEVGVGITITHDPLHGSGRADFPHPALALGDDAHAPQRIRMTDSRQRQPASDEAPHAIPTDAALLAPPRQRAMPKPADSESKNHQRRLVHERAFPARCPGRVLLEQVPFGQTVSLHPLRRRWSGFVRGLLRYFRSVRLPRSVRHRRASLDFPMRPRATAALGEPGISRFPFEVLRYVHGVCDRAGLPCTSRYRCTGWGLPRLLTASASRSDCLTRLNTRPAHSLVNASTPPSRAAPHDSGPLWVATSHSYDSFIHYTSPV